MGLTLAKGLAEYFSSYYMSHIGQSVIADVRSSLYDRIIHQAAPFFSKHPTNELTAHLMSDAALVERAVSDTLRDLLRESVSLIIYLALLFTFNWRLASALLLLGPPVALLVINFNRKLRRYINSRQQSGAEMLDVAQEAISSQRVVKAFGMEDYEKQALMSTAPTRFPRIRRATAAYACPSTSRTSSSTGSASATSAEPTYDSDLIGLTVTVRASTEPSPQTGVRGGRVADRGH